MTINARTKRKTVATVVAKSGANIVATAAE
jgi:hypothetical protein